MNMQWSPALFGSRRDSRWLPVVFLMTAACLVFAVLFGGASRGNPVQVAAIELVALPVLMCAIWRLIVDGSWKAHRFPLLIIAGIVAIPLVQLIPLPPSVWSAWPGHGAAAEGLRAAGIDIGWRPISLTPLNTSGHALALIPPIAIFLAALKLSERESIWLTSIIVAAALVSIAIGAVQITGGENSPFYFYDPTNLGSAVGLFSNRNHQAALLVAALPFAAIWVQIGRKSGRYRLPLIVAAVSVFMIAIIGLVIVKSRAGVFLLLPAVVASFMIVAKGDSAGNRRFVALFGGGTILVLFVAGAIGMGPLMERFNQDAVDGRGATTSTVLAAANHYLPSGSGIGSFVPVYSSVEPIETMGPALWNHAHNEYAELWLEAGVMALVALLAFAVWWLLATLAVWRGYRGKGGYAAQASVAVTALLIIHCTVDYPLRTLALACIFALACGIMERARTDPNPV